MEGQHDLGKARLSARARARSRATTRHANLASRDPPRQELNEEQRVLLNSKTTLERSLKEHESLKVQIEEIARDEQAHSGASHAGEGEIEPPEPAPARPDEKKNGHHTPTVAVPIIHEQTTQTDPELPPPPPPPVRAVPEENGARLFEEGESPDHKSIELLLKLLHVVGRYEGQTGATLPSEVDYMGKVVLGKTSLPEDNFFDALAQSVNDAVLYLERGEHSNMPVANGKTYKQLRELVDKLADSLCQPPTPTKTTAPQSPQLKINFFADPTGERARARGANSRASRLSLISDRPSLTPPLLRKAALDDMGEADLTLALDSMSEANVDALTSSVEPNAVHQAITVDDTVEIAAAGERERMDSRALRHPNGRTQPQV